MLRKILGEMGEDVFFEPSFRCEFGYNIKILDPGGIEIGDNVLFSPRVSIYTAKHAFDVKERSAGACFAKNVTIGNNVWVVVGVHTQKDTAIACGLVSGRKEDKTKLVETEYTEDGIPMIKDAATQLVCKVVDQKVVTNHTLFIAEAVSATQNADEVLLYHQKDFF